MRVLLVLAVTVAAATVAGAQGTGRDTLRVRDSTLRRDSLAMRDSIQRRDSLSRRDSLRGPDSLTRRDSLRARDTLPLRPRVLAPIDTFKPPLPEVPGVLGAATGDLYRWEGDQIAQTGAQSLAELLERIPGTSVLRSGYILAPQVVTWMGDPARVRIFLDGAELDAIDLRAGAARDLGSVDIWSMEAITVEATPTELRVHLRSWRVTSRIPTTRVDVYTGDDDTNLYRGFFGRRFATGVAAQFGFQQFGTLNRRVGGDGDGLSLFGRVGWAAGAWSTDLAIHRNRRSRNKTTGVLEAPAELSPYAGTATQVIARAAYGSPSRPGSWAQLIAASGSWREDTVAGVRPTPRDASDSLAVVPDSAASRRQIVALVGRSMGALQIAGGAHYRMVGEAWYLSPTMRGSWQRSGLALSARYEQQAEDSISRVDVSAQYRWRSRVTLDGGVSQRAPMWSNAEVASTSYRAGGSLRVRGWDLGAGSLVVAGARLAAPIIFQLDYDSVAVPERRGLTFSLRGPLYRRLNLDVQAIQWDSAGPYRPDLDVRARVYIDTEWRERFPRGDFTFRGAIEYRSVGDVVMPLVEEPLTIAGAAYWSSRIEIRIRTATISWQFRNYTGTPYQAVPGFLIPQRINFYGVRWHFSD